MTGLLKCFSLMLSVCLTVANDRRIVTPVDFANPDKMAGKVVRVDTYYEANNSENNTIATGCTGTLVYGQVHSTKDIPIYAVVTSAQCCNVEAATLKTKLPLSSYEHLESANGNEVQPFKTLKISAHISYGSNLLQQTTVVVIKGTFDNKMITVSERKIVEPGCSKRLGKEYRYQSINDFCVIEVDPRIQHELFPVLSDDNFHHMSNVEVKNPKDCRLIRWNDTENYMQLEEIDVNIVETKKCKDALSTYGISFVPDFILRSYCFDNGNMTDVNFMRGFKNPFIQLSNPNSNDFSDVGSPVVCKSKTGKREGDILLGLATLKAGNYTIVMDGSRIKSHLAGLFMLKRVLKPSIMHKTLDMPIYSYTHKHDTSTAAIPTKSATVENTSEALKPSTDAIPTDAKPVEDTPLNTA